MRSTTLADAVLRRTSAGATGHPGMRLLEAAADVMAQRLGWSAAERVAQIALVQRRYQTDASEAR
jgi:glycerol-3-phosphate dehydrogenase